MSASFCLTAVANSVMLLIVVDLTTSLLWTFWILPGDSYAASPASVHIWQPLLCRDGEPEAQGGVASRPVSQSKLVAETGLQFWSPDGLLALNYIITITFLMVKGT